MIKMAGFLIGKRIREIVNSGAAAPQRYRFDDKVLPALPGDYDKAAFPYAFMVELSSGIYLYVCRVEPYCSVDGSTVNFNGGGYRKYKYDAANFIWGLDVSILSGDILDGLFWASFDFCNQDGSDPNSPHVCILGGSEPELVS